MVLNNSVEEQGSDQNFEQESRRAATKAHSDEITDNPTASPSQINSGFRADDSSLRHRSKPKKIDRSQSATQDNSNYSQHQKSMDMNLNSLKVISDESQFHLAESQAKEESDKTRGSIHQIESN